MSYDKFAPMTSALLARKGEAAPSTVVGQRVPRETEARSGKGKIRSLKQIKVQPPRGKKTSAKSSPKSRATKPANATKRRIVLTLSKEEFERVEAAAGKRKNTPPRLARDALFAYLTALQA